MIIIDKRQGNDQSVNPDIKGMIAFLPSLILVISNNELTEQVWEQGRLDEDNVPLDSTRFFAD